MEERAHLVAVPKEGETNSAATESPATPKGGDSTEASEDSARIKAMEKQGISTKIIALIVVAVLLGAGGIYLWAEYFRHWTTADLEEQVISDPTVATPGFRHDLAGQTVTVEGKVADIDHIETTLGDLSFIYTHSSEQLALVVWGDSPYEIGGKVEMRVHFEWATCNDESHVYSPQVAFPWHVIPPMSNVRDAVSAVRGTVLIPRDIDSHTARLEVFDRYPALSLSDLNCSLRVGTSSYVLEYLDLYDEWDFGREIDAISNLSVGTSENDLVVFVDADDDGWLTAGDYFELSGIERPAEDSGLRTYMLNLGLTNVTDPEDPIDILAGSSYMAFTNRGLLRYDPLTPYGRGSASVDGNQVTVTCVRLVEQVSWDDLEIQLTDGMNFVTWYPSEDRLDDGAPSMENLGGNLLNGTEISCVVTDLAGNGCIDEGDYFVLNAYDGFYVSDYFTALLIFTVTHDRMFSAEFRAP